MVHCALCWSQLQCYRVQGIRESHDLKINLARDVSRDGGGAAGTSVITSTIDCAIVYKLSWTQPLSVATPAQYREHEYKGGNIWVLIADIKLWCGQDKQLTLFWPEQRGLDCEWNVKSVSVSCPVIILCVLKFILNHRNHSQSFQLRMEII